MGGFAANRDYAASNSSRHSLASISVDPCVCRGLESRQNWMKIRSICLALFMLGHAGGMCAQNSEAFTPIGQSAVATLHVAGFDPAGTNPVTSTTTHRPREQTTSGQLHSLAREILRGRSTTLDCESCTT
jgi:hypothetical protein